MELDEQRKEKDKSWLRERTVDSGKEKDNSWLREGSARWTVDSPGARAINSSSGQSTILVGPAGLVGITHTHTGTSNQFIFSGETGDFPRKR